ncbi:hypothetical protein DER46DRAFT_515202, partial [Fusarium sp. MPI-SDFR-AT-0072]
VTPTGGGKSLIFILPAYYMPNRVIVVIMLLVLLEDNIAARYLGLGINIYI